MGRPSKKRSSKDAGPAPAQPQWEARDETLTFPAEPGGAAAAAKLVLPSSGTAEEILARQAARELSSETKAVARAAEADAALPAARPALSFFSSAQAREQAAPAIATEHLATFFLEREEYGVDVRLVQEIIRVSEITPVPRAPEFIRGVINLRGRIIPVIDLKRKLGLGELLQQRASRIVVVKVRERLIGLLVDGASQVLKVPLQSIEAAPEEVVQIDQNFIRGVAKLAGRLIILVDLPKVLQVELRDALPGDAS
jgi:purine-binding chemotaxis protein CheW